MTNNDTSGRKPLAAVIVPVYNRSEDLKACVESIQAQTLAQIEIILVDDGSTDDSGEQCDRFAAEDPRVRVYHKKNGGLISAWMRGVRESTAPYLLFVDGDDWIEPPMAEELLAALDPSPELAGKQIVCCKGWSDRKGAAPEKLLYNLPDGIYQGVDLQKNLKDRILGQEKRPIAYSRCLKLFSRELIEKNMGYPDERIRMGEDLTISVPAMLDAQRIVILENAYYYHYNFNPGSMAHGFEAGLYDNARLLKQVMHRIVLEKHLDPSMEDEEYFLQLILVLKNGLRGYETGNGALRRLQGCIRWVQDICAAENTKELAAGYPRPLEDAAARLVRHVMLHPSAASVAAVRTVFRVQAGMKDKETGRRRA